jgi:branched-chain amino acid transport system permease protein
MVRERAEPLAVVAVLILARLVAATGSSGVSAGIWLLGIVAGAGIALQTLGVVLVYRANKIINFAQLQMSSVAGLLFFELVRRRTLLVGLHKVCSSCVPLHHTPLVAALQQQGYKDDVVAVFTASRALVRVEYLLSALIALAVCIGLVWLTYLALRLFREPSRLVLTVITLAAGTFTLQLYSVLVGRLFPAHGMVALAKPAAVPFELGFKLGGVRFSTANVLTLVAAGVAAGGLALFFRFSTTGLVMRAVSENQPRSQTLGIDTNKVVSRAWVLAGLVGGVASLLAVATLGSTSFDAAQMMVRVLAAAAIGSLASLPAAVAGALAIGALDQVVLRGTGSATMSAVILFVLIVVVLLAQRTRQSRAEVDSEATWSNTGEVRPTPAELRDVDTVRRGRRMAAAALGIVAAALPWILSPSQTHLATITVVYGMVTLSLLVLAGWAGQISLGQMAFAAAGGWVAAVLHAPFPILLLAAGLTGAGCSVLVGLPALRLRGLHLAITTLAFALATSAVLFDARYLGGSLPTQLKRPLLLGVNLNDDRTFYYLVLLCLGLAVMSVLGMRRSRPGRVLIACKDNEQAAQAYGINLLRARLAAFAVAGAMSAVAGALFVFANRGVDAGSFAPDESMRMFLLAVLGGLGSVAGPLLGAGWTALLQMTSTTPFAAVAVLLLAPGLGVMVLMWVTPGGLSQLVFAIRDMWLRRVAVRHRIAVPSLLADGEAGAGGKIPIAPLGRIGRADEAAVPQYALPRQWLIRPEQEAAARG